MSFIEVFAISGAVLGAAVSLVAALMSFLQIRIRVNIDRELHRRIVSELLVDNDRLRNLLNAELDGDIKKEISAHNDMYYSLILKVIDDLPGEKRSAAYNSLNQESKRGSAAYMTKLLKGSLRVIGAAL